MHIESWAKAPEKGRAESQGDTLQFLFTEKDFHLDAQSSQDAAEKSSWRSRFEEDKYYALYQMGFEEKTENLTASAGFLRLVSDLFLKRLTSLPELELAREKVALKPLPEDVDSLLKAVPFAIGAEYIDTKWINAVFRKLLDIFAREISVYNGTVEMYLTEKNQHLHVPERIFFHLVEHKDYDFPFAFLATYATKGKDGKVRHVPLKYALTEYGDEREKLLKLLACLNRAAEVSALVSGFMESGEMFHPLRLTAEEAYTFLKDIEAIEQVGILCRIPNWWKKRASSVSLEASLGDDKPSLLGFDTLISVQPKLVVDGMELTEEDIRSLLEQTEGLALLKGKWVEVDHEKLRELLARMEELPSAMTLFDAMQLELGQGNKQMDVGATVSNGEWLSEFLMHLRKPETIRKAALPKSFCATLRPYQKNGFTWLNYMDKLGFGACLADDMGLGKTVQVLAYLEKLRTDNPDAKALLVLPASLLGNWKKEAEKFAPDMDLRILHGKSGAVLEEELTENSTFLTITTYGMVPRIKKLQEIKWDCIILDEAQAIKNAGTKQTREIKKLSSRMRVVMTGTPIENELMNLWSLFDFLNKGLLGSSKEFHEYCKGLDAHPEGYMRLKAMVSPFMLRRVKTDKKIISDLPEKLESVDYVSLSKKQIVLYRKAVADMEKLIAEVEGIQRSGIILTTIMKLKQICNHPDQYLGQTAYAMEESGKLLMLKEICETIYEKRERVIVFTQFKEITEHLAAFLEQVFGRKGYVLHGGTPVAKRGKIVEEFQGESYVPFIVVSVKAGGTGLNLTKANHVIHFDRWWNPAVENQATDRAFRIGQKKDVVVHKLVCQGTIEEKIDAMIASKKELAENVIGSGGEKWITELNNEELMSMLRLEMPK
ncbi:MAG TPA: ATP-dependent helicase [Lachnospiraceae bacterium]|nr:ATP-dependent helicase [Lachnospiraceae bacterium]